MTDELMHENEVQTDAEMVRRLLRAQFPQWADLPIERISSYGTDHAIYRLGGELSVRLPRVDWATRQVERELRWLPKFAPHLPLTVPAPLAMGEPGEGFPWRWSISPWIEGSDVTAPESLDDLERAALDLAAFITALQRIDATDGPRAGRSNFYRGVPLAWRDANTRSSILEWEGILDTQALMDAWETALAAPPWDGPPLWIHGDLLPGNIIARDGRLSAVIDFGCLGVGDPAVDLVAGWALFSGKSREVFRNALNADDATWARGRGWALTAAGVLPYYRHTNPGIVARARRQLEEILAEQRLEG